MILALEGDYCLAAVLNVKDVAAHDAFMHRKPRVRKRRREDVGDNAKRVWAMLNNDYIDEYARVRKKYGWTPVP